MNKVFNAICISLVLLHLTSYASALEAPPVVPLASSWSSSTEAMQKATAISLGNMAWEGISVSEVATEGAKVKWLATTPTGKWQCQADIDGKRPYCER